MTITFTPPRTTSTRRKAPRDPAHVIVLMSALVPALAVVVLGIASLLE